MAHGDTFILGVKGKVSAPLLKSSLSSAQLNILDVINIVNATCFSEDHAVLVIGYY